MKPRIRKYKGEWYCFRGVASGKGETPQEAYKTYVDNPTYLFCLWPVTVTPWQSLESIRQQNHFRTWDYLPNWERVA